MPTYLQYCFSFEPRVENLRKFKSDGDECPTLVCTDLAARGLDLDVDHVVMFDFPLNSVSIVSMFYILGQSTPALFLSSFLKLIDYSTLLSFSILDRLPSSHW